MRKRLSWLRHSRPIVFWMGLACVASVAVTLPLVAIEEGTAEHHPGHYPTHAPKIESKPNLMLVLVDDIGYSDMEWTASDLLGAAPTIAKYASAGTILANVYAQYQCTPTRAALMTGRYPARYAMQEDVFDAKSSQGVPRNESTIAEHLRLEGYRTIMVGKWHIGCAYWHDTPTGRGFEKYYGFMCNGGLDYDSKQEGDYYDLWQNRVQDYENVGDNTNRTDLLFGSALKTYIRKAPYYKPLFVYFASQDPHGPLMAPEKYMYSGTCNSIVDETRQIYCGMVRALDGTVQAMIDAMNETGRLDNSILFFLGDNGGAPDNGGYNYPLRSSKGSLFDGGAKQVSFVWAGDDISYKPPPLSTYYGVMHAVDLYPTFLRLGSKLPSGQGPDPHSYPGAILPKDGVDMWDAIVSQGDSPRTEVPIWIGEENFALRMIYNGKDYKMIVGEDNDGWYPPPSADGSSSEIDGTGCGYMYNKQAQGQGGGEDGDGEKDDDECVFLFEMVSDPYEQVNLLNPDEANYTEDSITIAYALQNRMAEILEDVNSNPDDDDTDDDDENNEDIAKEYAAATGFWGPFMSWYIGTTTTSTTTSTSSTPAP